MQCHNYVKPFEFRFSPVIYGRINEPLPYNKMKNNNNEVNETSVVTFPQALMAMGITLVKTLAKTQLKFSLLWADAILLGHDGQALIKACYVAAGYVEREARGTISNSSKFVAPALAFREGKISEKEFFALKMTQCAPIFKENGGMDGEGLNPDAWLAMRDEIANREPLEKESKDARPPSGEQPSLSAFQILSAAISLRKSELNEQEIDQLIMLLRA